MLYMHSQDYRMSSKGSTLHLITNPSCRELDKMISVKSSCSGLLTLMFYMQAVFPITKIMEIDNIYLMKGIYDLTDHLDYKGD